MSTTEIARRENGAAIQSSASANQRKALMPQSYTEAFAMAEHMAKSGMFAVKTAEQAIVVLMTGLEMGFGPAMAMRGISVIQGKPSPGADALEAACLVRRDICKYFHCIHSDAQAATYRTHRVGAPDPREWTFTWDMAKQANLVNKDNWKSYPEAMLRARCIATLARMVYPDLSLGLYIPDESEDFSRSTPRSPDAPRPEIAAPPLSEFPSQRKAAQPEKPQRAPESAALLAKVTSAIKASLDEAQIAELKAQHGPLTKLSDEQLGQVYAQVEAINAAKTEAAAPDDVEGDPFAPGAE